MPFGASSIIIVYFNNTIDNPINKFIIIIIQINDFHMFQRINRRFFFLKLTMNRIINIILVYYSILNLGSEEKERISILIID